MDKLLELPVTLQVAIGAGYITYCLAYLGTRRHHTAIDVTLSTLGFSLITTLLLITPGPFRFSAPTSIIGAILITLSIGVGWRSLGRGLLQNILRKYDVTWADDCPSAFAALTSDTRYYFTQVGVQLKDGTWLRCDDTQMFAEAPHGPFRIGDTGDIGLYVTHEEVLGQPVKELTTTRADWWGDMMTYVPQSEVKTMVFRYKPRS